MKGFNLVYLILFFIILCACERKRTTGFIAVAEEVNDSIVLLKWESQVPVDSKLIIRAASSRADLNNGRIVANTTVAKQHINIKRDQSQPRQQFYQFEWGRGNKFVIATRRYYFSNAYNFRDMGGYSTIDDKEETRWGMLYRGDCTEGLPEEALREFGIRTVIDMRTPAERSEKNDTIYDGVKVVNFVFCPPIYEYYYNRALAGELTADSVPEAILKIHIDILEKKTAELKAVFEILCDSTNYPVLLTCTSSKFIVGLLACYIYAILDIEHEDIVQDYALSSKYIRVPSNLVERALSVNAQEALTKFYSSDKMYIDMIYDYVLSKYGTVEDFLHSRVGLDDNKMEELRDRLLVER